MCFTGFSARLIYLQVAKHDEYAALAMATHGKKQIIFARRGLIMDINQETLADNDPVRTVVADASLITDPDDAASVMAQPLGLDEADLRQKLASGRRYMVLKKEVPEAVARGEGGPGNRL